MNFSISIIIYIFSFILFVFNNGNLLSQNNYSASVKDSSSIIFKIPILRQYIYNSKNSNFYQADFEFSNKKRFSYTFSCGVMPVTSKGYYLVDFIMPYIYNHSFILRGNALNLNAGIRYYYIQSKKNNTKLSGFYISGYTGNTYAKYFTNNNQDFFKNYMMIDFNSGWQKNYKHFNVDIRPLDLNVLFVNDHLSHQKKFKTVDIFVVYKIDFNFSIGYRF